MHQSHFLRNVQPLGLVGRSPVQGHDEEIIRVIVPDLMQKAVHALRVHFFCRHEVERPLLGAHRCILIDEFPHQGQRNNRAGGAGVQSVGIEKSSLPIEEER